MKCFWTVTGGVWKELNLFNCCPDKGIPFFFLESVTSQLQAMMFVPWQVSQTGRGRPSSHSGWTFWLKTSNVFINSPLRFLFLLMLIKTKEHTRQRSEKFPLGLFTLIVKKPWTFPEQLVEGDMILVRTENHVSVSASCSTYLRGPCDEIISRDWQSFSHSKLCEKSRKT